MIVHNGKPVAIGDGVTQMMGSDRYPYTIVAVENEKRLTIQADNYELIEGSCLSEHQTYRYTPNQQGELIRITLRSNGRWVKMGERNTDIGYSLRGREAYCDPSF
jgi:hypothetical protein